MYHPILATVTTQSQMHVQIKHSLAHLQDLMSTLDGIKYICKTHQPKQGFNLVDEIQSCVFYLIAIPTSFFKF